MDQTNTFSPGFYSNHLQPHSLVSKHEAVAEVIEDNFLLQPFSHSSFSPFPKRLGQSFSACRAAKQHRPEKKTMRTVVCIPYNSAMVADESGKAIIKIPRGCRRTHFSKLGLISKVEISTHWSEEQLRLGISNVFKKCFVDCEYLSFSFLTTVPECKVLQIPSVHAHHQWDAAAVTTLSREIFYILADPCHILKEVLDDTNELESLDSEPSSSVNELPTSSSSVTSLPSSTMGQVTSTSTLNAPKNQSTSAALYNDYLKLLNGEELNPPSTQEKLMLNRHELGRLKDGFEALEMSLCDLRAKIIDEKVNYLLVNRQTLFDDAILNVKRENFEENARFFVRFSDDLVTNTEKVYTDGINREYFRLLMANIINSSIFAGEDHAKYLTKCDTAASQDHYFLFGRLIALSVIHGGPGPSCFSRLLYQQILNKPRTYSLNLIDSASSHELISKISNSTSAKEFSNAIKKAQLFLELAGIYQLDFACKNEVVASCLKFYLEDRIKGNLERFLRGLNTLSLLDEVMKHPKGFESVFVHDREDRLTATKIIDDVFTVQYSDGNDSRMEAKIIEFWQSYLFDVEEGKVSCRFEDILMFCTGADRIPPAGFVPMATITFSQTSKFPQSKTCANILSLPLGADNASYEWFRDTMDFAILNSPGFG